MIPLPAAVRLKLSAFQDFSASDERLLSSSFVRRRHICPGEQISLGDGHGGRGMALLIGGWCCSEKHLASGDRQVINVQLPGDFIGLESVFLHNSDCIYEAITHLEAIEIGGRALSAAMSASATLSAAVLWSASRDGAVLAERIVDLGRRSALTRTAHFLLELRERLTLVGLASPDGFECPLTQFQLADILGLSAIHMNRTLKELRSAGRVTFRGGYVSLGDASLLIDIAAYDGTFLDQPTHRGEASMTSDAALIGPPQQPYAGLRPRSSLPAKQSGLLGVRSASRPTG